MVRLSWEAAGGDPAPGDPAAFDELAQALGQTAANAEEAHGRLTRLAGSVDESIWRGEAAEAFRGEIAELPPLLAKLHDSYQAASEGMTAYGRVLRELQAQARGLLVQAQAAQDEQVAQQRARDQAQTQDPLAPTVAYEQAITDAQRRVGSARSQIDEVRERRRAAENAAIASLERAGELGIRNDPWYKRAWEGFEGWVDDNADVLSGISTALKWVSAAAGVLSFIPVLAPIFGPIALAAGGAALLLDAALVATGNGSWKALAVDAALLALPGAGKLISGVVRGGRAGSTAARISTGLRAKGVPRAAARQVGTRIARGNKFNVTRRPHYQANEVRLTNGKIVDSYSPGRRIVSRKHTQLAQVKPETAKGYVREAADKYSPGEVIADTPANRAKYPELIGKELDGHLVLEVPRQRSPIPQEVLDEAAQQGVRIDQVSDFAAFQVGPPVSQVPETYEALTH